MQNEEFDPLETDLDLASLKKELIQPKLTPDQLQSALQRYVEEMSRIDRDQFRKTLHELFARNVYFKDPFNEVRGLADLEQVYAKLFALHPDAVLRFHLHAGSGDTGYVEWHLHYTDQGRPIQRNGVSKLLFDEQGRVRVQMDYWDSGEHYFRRLPVLGSLLDWLASKRGV